MIKYPRLWKNKPRVRPPLTLSEESFLPHWVNVMSEYDQLLMYSKVVETGSFTAAGELLGISANAVSKQVTQLEQKLGLTLLERSTRQLIVTEMGKIIYEKSKAAQKNIEEVNEYAQFAKVEPSGILSVASTIGIGQYLLTPHLKEFLQKYPKLTLKLNLIDKFPDFRPDFEEAVDIAYAFPQSLIPEKLSEPDLIRRRLNEIQRGIYATPAYLAKYGEPKNYEDLQHHLLIFHARYQDNNLVKECEKRHLVLPKILYINNTVAILNCVLADMGIAICPHFCAQKDLSAGKLVRILENHQEPSVTTYTFYKKTPYLPPKITWFMDFFNAKLLEINR